MYYVMRASAPSLHRKSIDSIETGSVSIEKSNTKIID